MGRLVNVVTSTGKVVAVPEEEATYLARESPESAAQRGVEASDRAQAAGIGPTVGAGLEGALDTLSLGGYGKIEEAVSDEAARQSRIRAQEHPYARGVGELAALAAPTGLLGDAAKAGMEVSGVSLAAKAGELATGVGGKLAGRAVEGGILGTGAYVAGTNVSGDDLTIEGVVESAGLGAILNLGAGAIADHLEGVTGKAKRAAWEADDQRALLDKAQKGADLGLTASRSDQLPSWNEFRDAHQAAQDSIAEYNREVAKEAEKYENFYSTSKLGSAADATQKVVDTLRNERYAAQNANVQWIEGQPRGVQYVYDVGGENERRILTNSPPPASQELAERFKDYNRRLSRVYKLEAGGWELDESGKWVRSAGVQADPKRALEELRSIQTDLKAEFPKASHELRKWGDLPEMPREPRPYDPVELPATVRDFSRMHADTVARLANGLDPAAAQAFDRFVSDLGLEPGSGVADVHATLRDYSSAIDDVKREAARKDAEEAKKPLVLRLLNKAVRYSVGRTVDVGGAMGAVTRVLGGEAAGRVMTGIEDTALGGALAEAKQGIRDRVRNLVEKYGIPTADTVRKLGPITAYLQKSFPSGKPDPETNPGRLAVNRINDILAANATAPDQAFMALDPLLGHPGDVALKMHQHIVGTLQYLVSTLPSDPGVDTQMFKSNWTPQWHDAVALAHRLEAVQDPITAIARAIAGDSHPAATEALWARYPAIMSELAQEIAIAAPSLSKLTYEQGSAYSNLFRTPLTGLQHPVVVTTIQGLYMNAMTAGQGGGGGGARPSQPNGRPPAVQSSVAGSSVNGLVSQQ